VERDRVVGGERSEEELGGRAGPRGPGHSVGARQCGSALLGPGHARSGNTSGRGSAAAELSQGRAAVAADEKHLDGGLDEPHVTGRLAASQRLKEVMQPTDPAY